jgi:SulP family sulfate permease
MLAALLLTPLIYHLPQATLAATIIVAVLSLVDLSILKKTWTYSRADFAAVSATILLTLGFGVEIGVTAGVVLSILIHLYKSSRPHMAVVGRVPGTEHFRNVKRHKVETDSAILTLRVDESLYFANARYLEDKVYDMVAQRPGLEHFVLMCPAVNEIDMSALESLEAINERLKALNVKFHLSEIKGPVMDRLKTSDFLTHLTGKVFLSQHQAIHELAPNPSSKRIDNVPIPRKDITMTIRIGDTAPNFTGRHHQWPDRFSPVDRLVLGVLLQPSGRFHTGLHHRDGPHGAALRAVCRPQCQTDRAFDRHR